MEGSWWSPGSCVSARMAEGWTPTETGMSTGASRSRTTILQKSTPALHPSGSSSSSFLPFFSLAYLHKRQAGATVAFLQADLLGHENAVWDERVSVWLRVPTQGHHAALQSSQQDETDHQLADSTRWVTNAALL